jgi:hypothetical protein
MSEDSKKPKNKGGRPRGSKNKTSTALAVLDRAAGVLAPKVEALKADKKLYTLGKDNLARISEIMMRYALAYSPEEKDEKGEPRSRIGRTPPMSLGSFVSSRSPPIATRLDCVVRDLESHGLG